MRLDFTDSLRRNNEFRRAYSRGKSAGAAKRQFNACHNVTRAQFDAGVTYLELMWDNVGVLKEALG